MIISQLESISYARYKVFIDEEFAFVLYKGELSRYSIQLGAELSVEVYNKIKTEVIFKRAKLKAMHLLERMNRTESNLRQKLKQGLYPEDALNKLLFM